MPSPLRQDTNGPEASSSNGDARTHEGPVTPKRAHANGRSASGDEDKRKRSPLGVVQPPILPDTDHLGVLEFPWDSSHDVDRIGTSNTASNHTETSSVERMRVREIGRAHV